MVFHAPFGKIVFAILAKTVCKSAFYPAPCPHCLTNLADMERSYITILANVNPISQKINKYFTGSENVIHYLYQLRKKGR
jgi:hypothetical protein